MARPRPALTIAAAIVGCAVVALIVARPSSHAREDDGVRVVEGKAALSSPLPQPLPVPAAAALPKPAPPLAPLLREAPPVVAALHARTIADGRDLAIETRMADAFASNAALQASGLTVTCGKSSCEVHGTAARDEASARLAIRSPEFLDTVERLGYTAGTDMISGRGGSSEFVVYLDRAS